ncbi:MAG: PH domain-containing protein [Lachnospiraceae bacterium]|nr:PH domain-containing protein [Lachnospiraceae bacterium]
MNYQIEGTRFKSMILFKEDGIYAGLKTYRYEDITSIDITYEPTVLSAGVVTCLVNGKKVNLSFAKSSLPKMKEAVEELKTMIKERDGEQEITLRTAEDMLGFCMNKGLVSIFTRRKCIADFRVVAQQVKPDEKIHYCFTGHYQKYDQTGRVLVPDTGVIAFAVTNHRIIAGSMEQKKKNAYSVAFATDIVVRAQKDILYSVVTIENFREVNKIIIDTQILEEVSGAILKNL